MATGNDRVTVASFETAAQAEAARDSLEEGGIPADLVDLGIEVPRADAARALEILRTREAAAREAAAEEALAEDEGDLACIACGARIPEYLERCPACGFSYS